MKLSSIIWMPLAVLLVGCGGSEPKQKAVSPSPSQPPEKAVSVIGSTPGFPMSATQKRQLQETARATGVSEKELEALRVYGTHVGMYPEDGLGTVNDRARKREQSRRAAGY